MPLLPDTEGDLLIQRPRQQSGKLLTLLVILMAAVTTVLVFSAIYLIFMMMGAFPLWQLPVPEPDVQQVVATPNLVGLDYIHAQHSAREAGFSLRIINAYIDGTVTRQSPEAGAKLQQGSFIVVQFALTMTPESTKTTRLPTDDLLLWWEYAESGQNEPSYSVSQRSSS